MNTIIVLIKQVPDTISAAEKPMRSNGTLNRSALSAVVNPEDLHALELALRVKEQYGGTVWALSMGPPRAAEVLREAIYRGADRAALLSDSRFAGSDTLATSYVLARAIHTIGGYDLVVCGRQAADGNTAQVGPQVAEKLAINQLTCVCEIAALSEGMLQAWRETDDGRELVQSRLPVLVTAISSDRMLRPPSARRMLRYRHSPVADTPPCTETEMLSSSVLVRWKAEDIGADPSRCGIQGSPTRVKNIRNVVLRGTSFKNIEASEEGIAELLMELVNEYTLE